MDKAINVLILTLFMYAPWGKGGKEMLSFSLIQALIVIIALLSILKQKKSGKTPGTMKEFAFPLTLFLIALLISVLRSVYLNNSLSALAHILSLIVFYRVLVWNLTSRLKEKILDIIFCSSAILALIGIAHSMLGSAVKATFPNRNLLAGYLVIGMVIGLSGIMTGRRNIIFRRADPRFKKSLPFVPALLLIFVCLVLTRSRGAYISMLCAVSFLVVRKYGKKGMKGLIVAFALGIFFFPFSCARKILKTEDVYALQRLNIWKSGIRIFMDHPVFGIGPGNFGSGFLKYRFPVDTMLARYDKYTDFAHNEYIQLAAESGLIALFLAGWIMAGFLKRGLKLTGSCGEGRERYRILAAFAATLAILTHAFFDFNLHLPATALCFVFFMSVMAEKEGGSETSRLNRPVEVAGLSLLLVFVILTFCARVFAQKEDFLAAAGINPLDAEYYCALADREAEGEKRLSYYTKALRLHPHEPYYHERLGIFHYSRGNLIDALKECREALKYDPRNPFLNFNLASHYFNRGEFRKAVTFYLKTVDMEPNYMFARYLLAESYRKLSCIENAKEEYDRILKLKNVIQLMPHGYSGYEKRLIDFDYSLVYAGLGKYWTEKGNPDQAVVCYRKALELKENPEEIYGRRNEE